MPNFIHLATSLCKYLFLIALALIVLSNTYSNAWIQNNISPACGPTPQACPIRIINPLVNGTIWLRPRNIAATQNANEAIWNQLSELSLSDHHYSFCTLNPGQSSSTLWLRDFDLHIAPGSIIHGMEIQLEGHTSNQSIQLKQIQLTDQNGIEIGENKSNKQLLPGSQTKDEARVFGSSKDLWAIKKVDPSNLNSEFFGIKMKFINTGTEISTIFLDRLIFRLYYTLETNTCNYNCNLFYVDPVPGAIGYHWTLPKNASIISANPKDHLIIINQQFADPLQLQEICVQTESAAGLSEPCCFSYYKSDCKTGSIGNKIWRDDNADGIQNENEPGIANSKVVLFDALTNKQVRQVYTKADGTFSLDNLVSGYYYLKYELPDQSIITKIRQGSNSELDSDVDQSNGIGTTENIFLASGQIRNDIDCGLFYYSTIGDLVWEDNNANGIQDAGEPGLKGIKLYLISTGGLIVDSSSTDQDGKYIFKNVIPGKYKIYIPPIEGYTSTVYQQGNNSLSDNDLLMNGSTQYVDILSSINYGDLDFGFVPTAKVSGVCWYDYGQEGIHDPNDKPMKDITIFLLDEFDAIIDSTNTNAAGLFQFPKLASKKNYRLLVKAGSTYSFTLKDGSGYDYNDSDVDNNGRSDLFSLSKNDSLVIDAGLFFNCTAKTSSLKLDLLSVNCFNGDSVFISAHLEGTPIIPQGYVLKYVLAYGPFQKILQISDQANFEIHSNGIFNIYQLIFSDQKDNYNFFDLSFVYPGITNMVDLSSTYLGRQLCVAIASRPLSFYLDNCIDISGKVWQDINENGKKDISEPGVGNAMVYLNNSSNVILDSIYTTDLGTYQFDNLNPSLKYRIVVRPIKNHHFTLQNATASDLDDSDVDQDGKSDILFLSPGSKAVVDAGVVVNHNVFVGTSKAQSKIQDEINESNLNLNIDETINPSSQQDKSLVLYPNPFHDKIQILVSLKNPFVEYFILNSSNTKIKSGILNASHNSIDLDELNSGLYLFQWRSRDSNGVWKLIKM